jgi:hypothetical protein
MRNRSARMWENAGISFDTPTSVASLRARFSRKRAQNPCLRFWLQSQRSGRGFSFFTGDAAESLASAGRGADTAESFFGKKPQ